MDLIDTSKSAGSCCSGCSGCAAAESAAGPGREVPLVGGRFVAASVGFFLGPLVLAVAGAFCSGRDGGRQLLGAIAGLAAGMAVSVVVARLLVPSGKEIG
jgi:hypothetical protein